ncbi:arginase family protein [Micromonospora sp. KC606]|uniref:arginase family protein n=1 Tax=Micromonospora sp. KC606 TaxID=2530379 RepID=UPI001FB7A120|nr:arginase family protein [Micromonospora sp. KC606]
MMRRIAVLDAPTNLGLRPPTSTSVPGCAKAPGALRDHGLLARLRAHDAGCLTPPRYDPGDWRPGDGVCHAREISAYSVALADRIGAIIDRGEFPLVLGGDCSVLLGSALAMHRLGEAVGGRIGLIFVDGHSDFRHPGNASYVGAAAGEDLALVTGRGQADLAAIEGRRPYFRDVDVVVLGIRAQDEYRLDLQAAGITTRPVPALRAAGAARTAQWAHEQLEDCAGYWVHIDVDVLDPAVMPAVDAPDPGGIAFAELEILLAGLVDTPHCLGVELTVFDPDYDPDGAYAAEIVNTVVAGLAPVRAPESVPPRLLAQSPPPRRMRGADGPGPRDAAPARPGGADALVGVGPAAADDAGVAPAGAGAEDRRGVAPSPFTPAAPASAVEPVGPPASAGPGLLRRLSALEEDVPLADGPPPAIA